MKTPEELAEEYADLWPDMCINGARKGFLAGYQAGRSNSEAVQAAAAPQWISVKDRLPKDASDVLIAWADGVSEACFCDDRWCRDGRMLRSVTHWMPLPKPPKE
jgi:hypothetical protein